MHSFCNTKGTVVQSSCLTKRKPANPDELSPRRPPLQLRMTFDGIPESRQDRPESLAALPGLHELRRARARDARLDSRRAAEPAVHPAGTRTGHQLLRHVQL